MPRDTAQESRDNINQGIPAHSGLDEGTKASLQRSLDRGTSNGIVVGSFKDLQTGATAEPLEDRPLNPNQSADGVVLVTDLPDPQADAGEAVSDTDKSSKSKKK